MLHNTNPLQYMEITTIMKNLGTNKLVIYRLCKQQHNFCSKSIQQLVKVQRKRTMIQECGKMLNYLDTK
jgi:hypothetical protein